MLTLYHGSTSVCAIKARITLEEKGLPWQSELLDLQRGDQHRPEYLRLNPNAVVPTLVHDGRVLIESTLIKVMARPSFDRAVNRWFTDADRERFRVDREAVGRMIT